MRMPVYVISNNTYIRKKGDYLVISNDGKKIPCPSEGTSYIVKYGNSQISNQVLNYLSDKGIPVFRFSYGGKYNGAFMPPNHNIGKSRLKQYGTYFDNDRRLFLAKDLVERSAKNKIEILRKYVYKNKDEKLKIIIKSLGEYSKKIKAVESVDSLRGVEGNITKTYFKGLRLCIKFYDFGCREYRPPRDEVNCLLSFGYSLLYVEVLGKILEHGLCQFLGVLHEQNNDANALVYDISELFRNSFIDSFVVGLINNGEIKDGFFNRKEDGAVLLNTYGKQFFLRKWICFLKKTVIIGDDEMISHQGLVRKEVVKVKRFFEDGEDF